MFNITSWGSFVWVLVGLVGQTAFFGRMMIQWIVSESRKESVVPSIFWWLSLGGGVMLFVYFVWRQDVVGVLGQSSGVVIYARNLRLLAKRKRAMANGSRTE
ncbi:MAG: lipid-A-disaccharide synthase N-terminal domain-containing protein [Phycisphaerales bacterium]|nr:MAG: lipid-A-disaccharide synthase N-terminal domain-containing protein [Phycisphaerales bacterium]